MKPIDRTGVTLMRDASIGRQRGSAGFSLLEMVIAAALLMFIALGLIPLFVRSIRDNETGSDFTTATSGNKSKLEESSQIPLDTLDLVPDLGTTQHLARDSWTQGDSTKVSDRNEGWWAGIPTDKGRILWKRESTVYQYGMSSLDKQKGDYVLSPNERLPGGTNPIFAPLKEIEVVVESETQNTILGGRRRMVFHGLKAWGTE